MRGNTDVAVKLLLNTDVAFKEKKKKIEKKFNNKMNIKKLRNE